MRLRTLAFCGLGALLLVALLWRPATAQTLAANEAYVNTPFQLAWTHDGVNTLEYQLFRNNVLLVTGPVAMRSPTGQVVMDATPSTGLALGTYTYRVDSVGDGGVTPSADFVVIVKARPLAPVPATLPRLIRVP